MVAQGQQVSCYKRKFSKMKNQLQNGDAIYIPVASQPGPGLVSGQVYLFGSMIGVAGFSTQSTTGGVTTTVIGVLWLTGVYTLPKHATQAWTIGELLYWDNGLGVVSGVNDSTDKVIGVAAAAAGSTDTTGAVRLNGAFAA